VSWLGVAGAVGYVSARWVRARLRSYRLGADIEADAFAMAEVELLPPRGRRLRSWGWCRGCPVRSSTSTPACPVEAYIRTVPVHLPLPPHGQGAGGDRNLHLRDHAADRDRPAVSPGRVAELGGRGADPARGPLGSAGARRSAALATLMGSVQMAHAMTEVEDRFAIPATPRRCRRNS
jgi:hypothetical protein